MTEPPRTPRRRAARLLGLLLLTLLGASLLAPDAVDSWADSRDPGWERTLARVWADPAGDLARRLALDVPLRELTDLVDGARTEVTRSAVAPAIRPEAGTTPTTVAPRSATSERPLRILAVGDSLMLDLQYGMERELDPRMDVVVEGRGALGFGFTVPHWDWEDEVLTDYDRLEAPEETPLAQAARQILVSLNDSDDILARVVQERRT